jgi:hypothetical protein
MKFHRNQSLPYFRRNRHYIPRNSTAFWEEEVHELLGIPCREFWISLCSRVVLVWTWVLSSYLKYPHVRVHVHVHEHINDLYYVHEHVPIHVLVHVPVHFLMFMYILCTVLVRVRICSFACTGIPYSILAEFCSPIGNTGEFHTGNSTEVKTDSETTKAHFRWYTAQCRCCRTIPDHYFSKQCIQTRNLLVEKIHIQ